MSKINWPEVEKIQGETLNSIYARTGSIRETGKIFAKGIRNKTGISYSSIVNELDRRGIERKGSGGNNFRGHDAAKKHYEKIISLPGYEHMPKIEIMSKTGLTINQFANALRYCNFNYLREK